MSGASTKNNNLPGILLVAIFFVSGAAALIFETLWFRHAGLAFGNSVWASSLVLASFMAGLTLGNALAARFGGRIQHRLRAYALLEVLIAVTGVGLVLVLPSFGRWLAPVFRSVADHLWLTNVLRLGFGFTLLSIPAIAMGATLPIVVKQMTAWDRSFGSVLGKLYGWNTIGAVVGALAGEALLIAALGTRGTALVAAGFNLLAAGAAMTLATRFGADGQTTPDVETTDPERDSLGGRGLLCCCAAFASGAILLAFEVVWFRFLHLFVHGGSLAFACMLAAVLAGIGLGGVTAGAWLRRDGRADRHALAVALIAGAVSASLYGLFRLAIEPYGALYISDPLDVLYLAALLTFPASFLSGILFTLTGAMLQRILGRAARTAGLITLSNTAGAGLGPLIAGFVLLPTLGMEKSFFVLASSYALVAALLFAARAPRWRPATRWTAAVLFLAALLRFPFGMLENDYLLVPIRRSTPGTPMKTVAVREGRSETLVYLRSDFLGQPLGYKLITDGFGMAGTFLGARRYMKLFVYWPVAMHPDPESALLISYGTGSTARALVDTPNLKRIDVVDTSREILEMSTVVYPEPGQNPLDDGRVNVHVEDGRYFLQTTPRRYDLITGEPPPPKIGGVVYLYTREYFQLIYDRLEEGGINTYWLPVTNLTDTDARSIIRAYCDVFPDCSLWAGFRLNWMLAGSRNAAWNRSDASFVRQWNELDSGTELRILGFEFPEQIGSTFLADPETLAGLTSDVPPLTDDHPKRLSDHHSKKTRGVDVFRSWMDASVVAERFARSPFIRQAWPPSFRSGMQEAFDYQRIVNEIYARPAIERTARQRMEDLHTLIGTDLRTLVLWEVGLGSDEMRIIEGVLAAGNAPPALAFPLAARAMAMRDFSSAASYFAAARAGSGQDARALQLQLYALCMAERKQEARAIVLELDRQPDSAGIDPTYWDWMRETFDLGPD